MRGIGGDGIDEGLALVGYGALGAIVGLWLAGAVSFEAWTWGVRPRSGEGASFLVYGLVACSALTLWGRLLLRRRREP